MMRRHVGRTLILLTLPVLLFGGCAPEPPADQEASISWLSPLGAPTLAFFDQGDNENFVTNGTPQNVLAEFLKAKGYDAIVFDAVNGLRTIKKHSLDIGLARIITGGNFYLISLDKDKTDLPEANDHVVSFGENLMPDLVYKKLCKEHWKIPHDNVSYVKGVSELLPIIKAGSHGGKSVDYVFIAQPMLYRAMKMKENITVVRDIRAEWKAYSGMDAIPQAGLFVRKAALEAKKNGFEKFGRHLDQRIHTAITEPDRVAKALNEYGTSEEQTMRFGFDAAVAKAVQDGMKDGETEIFPPNGFGLVDLSLKIEPMQLINDFLAKMKPEETEETETFDESFFVSLY